MFLSKENVSFLKLKINVGDLDIRTEYRGQLVLQVHNLCWILIGLRTGTVFRYFTKDLCCTQFACNCLQFLRKQEQFAPFAWNLSNWIPRKSLRKLREMQIKKFSYSYDKAVYVTACTKNVCLHVLLNDLWKFRARKSFRFILTNKLLCRTDQYGS